MNTPLHTAIARELAHPAGALADPGTESLAEQLLPTQPAALHDDPAAAPFGIDLQWLDAFIFAFGIAVGVLVSMLWPLGWAPGL